MSSLLEIEGRIAFEKGAFEKALECIEKSGRAETSESARLGLAQALYATGKFERLLKLQINSPAFYALKGLALLKLAREKTEPPLFEEARACLEKAEPSKNILSALAEANFALKEERRVIAIVDQLLPEISEQEAIEFNYLKGCCLKKIDKPSALSFFLSHIHEKDPRFARSCLNLLIELKAFEKLESVKPELEKNLPKEERALLYLYSCQGSIERLAYTKAASMLLAALREESLSASLCNEAVQMGLFIAEKKDDPHLLEKIEHLAKGPLRESLLQTSWRLLDHRGENEKALSAAKSCWKAFPKTKKAANTLGAIATSACKIGQYDLFVTTIENFLALPKEERLPLVKNHLETLLLSHALKSAVPEKMLTVIEAWQRSLGESQKLIEAEGEILIRLKRLSDAQKRLAPFANSPCSGNIDALLCICHAQTDPHIATDLGEKALSKETSIIAPIDLYLELFNLYLAIHKRHETLSQQHIKAPKEPLNLAADHLYSIFLEDPKRISSKNITWLCEYFLHKKDLKSAEALFSHVKDPAPSLLYRLATVKNGNAKRSLELLNLALSKAKLTHAQDLICAISVEIGSKEELLGHTDKARQAYAQAIATHVQSYDADRAKLALYHIDFKQDRLDTGRALSDLKDIQLRKSLKKEPLFLNAALLYIDICAKSNEKNRQKLLENMQTDFCTGKTLFGQHYQKEREELPEQEALLKSYMLFVDLYIQYLDAKKIGGKKQMHKILRTLKQSVAQFNEAGVDIKNRAKELQSQIEAVLR